MGTEYRYLCAYINENAIQCKIKLIFIKSYPEAAA